MFVLLSLLALVAAVPAQANQLTADVPFDFEVGKTKLAAGKYLVMISLSDNSVRLRNEDGKTIIALTNPLGGEFYSGDPKLTFDKVGDRHVLISVHTSDGMRSRVLLQKLLPTGEKVSVALR